MVIFSAYVKVTSCIVSCNIFTFIFTLLLIRYWCFCKLRPLESDQTLESVMKKTNKQRALALKVILYIGKTIQVTEALFSSVSFNTSPLSRRFSPFIFGVTPPVEYRLSRERSERGRKKPDEETHAS